MKVNIELYHPNFDKYNKELFLNIAEDTIISSGVVEGEKEITISVAVVDEDEIKRVNKERRDKDVVTDVISIGDYSEGKSLKDVDNSQVFLGEVILCYTYIEQSARENKISVDREFFTVYSHGILHLLGFKHTEEMFRLQEGVSEKFCNL
ncbi:MAG: rRNA maturation RNase YbeY [Patescibacteria group bacterium]